MVLEWKTCIRVAITIIVAYLVIKYWDVAVNLLGLAASAAVPLLLGCVIAYIANIMMSFFERHFLPRSKKKFVKVIRRPICIILTFFSIVLLIFLIINMILPEIVACVQVLAEGFIAAVTKGAAWLEQNVSLDILPKEFNNLINQDGVNLRETIGKTINVLMTGVGGAMTSIMSFFSSAFSTIVTIIVALIFSIYLLAGKERLSGQFNRLMEIYLGKSVKEKIHYILGNFDESFHSFIVGQCIEAVILGVLCTIGMWILGLPYASMIGCLVGFTALIPMVGAYIGAIVGAFMIFTVSPIEAIVFLVFLIILQQIEGNLIYPRVVGASIGLPGIWVLVAVTVGGGMLGIGGMLIGVPLVAALYKMLRVDMKKRENVG